MMIPHDWRNYIRFVSVGGETIQAKKILSVAEGCAHARSALSIPGIDRIVVVMDGEAWYEYSKEYPEGERLIE